MARNDSTGYAVLENPFVLLQACIYGFVILCGTVTNAVIILTYIRWRRNMFETPRDMLIFNLAFGDLLMAFCASPFGFASSIVGKWSSGHLGCVWYGFVTTWAGLASILQLTGIAGERYLTLSHPDLRWTHICKRRTRSFTLFSWLGSGLASCFPLIGWSKYDLEGLGLHCSVVWSSANINYSSYSLFLLVFFFLIPVIIMVFSYTRVFFVVRRMSHEAEVMWGVGDRATKQSYIAEVRVAKQIFLLTGAFLFAWTPYAVSSFLIATNIAVVEQRIHVLPAVFAKLSSVYNPVIYYFTFKRLRRRSLKLFKSSAST